MDFRELFRMCEELKDFRSSYFCFYFYRMFVNDLFIMLEMKGWFFCFRGLEEKTVHYFMFVGDRLFREASIDRWFCVAF